MKQRPESRFHKAWFFTWMYGLVYEGSGRSVFDLLAETFCFITSFSDADICRAAAGELLHSCPCFRGLVLLWLHERLPLCFIQVLLLILVHNLSCHVVI